MPSEHLAGRTIGGFRLRCRHRARTCEDARRHASVVVVEDLIITGQAAALGLR